jgi:hypothetical protein
MAPEQLGSFGDGQRSDGERGHFEIRSVDGTEFPLKLEPNSRQNRLAKPA